MAVEISEELLADYKQTLKDAGLDRLSELTRQEDIVRLAQIVKLYKSDNNPQITVDNAALDVECSTEDINDMVSFFKDSSDATKDLKGNIESLYLNHTFWQQYGKDRQYWNFSYSEQTTPQDVMCGIVINKMYGPTLEGKTIAEISQMYPAKDGKIYFEQLSENLHKHLDDVIQMGINIDDDNVAKAHDHNIELERQEEEEEKEKQETPDEEVAEEEEPTAEDDGVTIDDTAGLGSLNNSGRVSLFDTPPEPKPAEPAPKPAKKEEKPKEQPIDLTTVPRLEAEIAAYNEKGEFPPILNKADFEQGLNQAVKETNALYEEKEIAPENLPAPEVEEENEMVSDYHAIARRIASDARLALMDAGVSEEICKEYEKIVKTQFERLHVESDYEKKCEEGCLFKADLADDIEAFTNGSDKLPYFIESDTVNKATANALDVIKNKYPQLNLDGFSSKLKYDLDKPALVKPEDEYVLSTDKNVPYTITAIDDPPDYAVNNASDVSKRYADLAFIKSFSYSKPKIENMMPAVKMFDRFVEDNPQFNKSIKAPYVAGEYKKTAKGKDGEMKTLDGDATDLFYIEGKNVSEYLSGKFKGYDKLSLEEKQYVAKAAIMNAIATGKDVDVKTFVQDPVTKECKVKISSVTLEKPQTQVFAKDKKKQEKLEAKRMAAAQKRAAGILKKEKAKNDKILGNLNRFAKNRAETLHNNYLQQTKEGHKAEEARKMEKARANNQPSRRKADRDLFNGEFDRNKSRTSVTATNQQKKTKEKTA